MGVVRSDGQSYLSDSSQPASEVSFSNLVTFFASSPPIPRMTTGVTTPATVAVEGIRYLLVSDVTDMCFYSYRYSGCQYDTTVDWPSVHQVSRCFNR